MWNSESPVPPNLERQDCREVFCDSLVTTLIPDFSVCAASGGFALTSCASKEGGFQFTHFLGAERCSVRCPQRIGVAFTQKSAEDSGHYIFQGGPQRTMVEAPRLASVWEWDSLSVSVLVSRLLLVWV